MMMILYFCSNLVQRKSNGEILGRLTMPEEAAEQLLKCTGRVITLFALPPPIWIN